MYHGTPAERAELRRTVIALPQKAAPKSAKSTASGLRQKISPHNPQTSPVSKDLTDTGTDRERKRRRIHRKPDEEVQDILHVESEHDEAGPDDDADSGSEVNQPEEFSAALFPVVITTYEMIIKDRVHLSAYDFSYIGSPITIHPESCLIW